ncbi:MAG: DNA-binding response regulator [Nitrospira sp.]|jgi:DNA-binding NarL/FixJ family response regulator|nr:MAG: DNA-binding response regulator [Nitrospira sp.]
MYMPTAARTTKGRTRASLPEPTLPPRKRRPEALTTREQEILELIWTGFKNKEIAQRLKISVKTVEAHRANMMKKIRVSNTAQLLKAAIQGKMLKLR